MSDRKVAMRKCIVTNQLLPKNELLRIVRTPDGVVTIDESGKLNGRGAYIICDVKVIPKLINSNILTRQLKCEIDSKFYQELENYFHGR